MKRALATRLVRLAAGLIADPERRQRYEEQWLADVEGAADVGMSPLTVAFGACAGAPAIARTPGAQPQFAKRSGTMPPIGILGLAIHLVHRGQRPAWVRIVTLALSLALLAGIGLLFT